jgi:hypothetical protein
MKILLAMVTITLVFLPLNAALATQRIVIAEMQTNTS